MDMRGDIGERGGVGLLCTSMMGSGILTIPLFFYRCGVIYACVLTLMYSFWTHFSIKLLLSNLLLSDSKNYSQLGVFAFGHLGAILVELNLFLIQFGQICAYLIILDKTFSSIFLREYGISEPYSLQIMILACIILFPMCYFRKTKVISVLSLFAMVIYFFFAFTIISTVVFGWKEKHYLNERTYTPHSRSIFISIPIICLSFSCHSNIFWVLNELKSPTTRKMMEITKKSILITTVFYIVIGIFGVVAFGRKLEGNILNNMLGHPILDLCVFFMLISTILSFPLVMNPCISSLDSFLFHQKTNFYPQEYEYYIPRRRYFLEIWAVFGLAIFVTLKSPSIEIFLGVTGAISGFTVGYILPFLLYLKVSPKEAPYRNRTKIFLAISCLLFFASILAILNPPQPPQVEVPTISPTLASTIAPSFIPEITNPQIDKLNPIIINQDLLIEKIETPKDKLIGVVTNPELSIIEPIEISTSNPELTPSPNLKIDFVSIADVYENPGSEEESKTIISQDEGVIEGVGVGEGKIEGIGKREIEIVTKREIGVGEIVEKVEKIEDINEVKDIKEVEVKEVKDVEEVVETKSSKREEKGSQEKL